MLFGIVLFAACEKDEYVVAQEDHPQVNLVSILRIAQQGIDMLEGDIQSRSLTSRRINYDGISCKIRPSTRAVGGDDTLYYVVNYADNKGFALVSADESISDGARLLAVVERGNYTAGEETGITGFDDYVNNISSYGYIRDSTILIPDNSHYEMEQTYSAWSSRGPYVQVMWEQGASNFSMLRPYNRYCLDENNHFCPAGCVVVALAHIMSYHKKPATYKRTHDGSNVTVSLDWDAINTWIGGANYYWGVTEADEIAHLFREIGERGPASYAISGTGMDTDETKAALAAFGYNRGTVKDVDFSLIVQELINERPVLMSGSRLDENNELRGHSWVADGYKSRTCHTIEYKVTPQLLGEDIREVLREYDEVFRYVHHNWGHGGECNGYFSYGTYNTQATASVAGGYDNPTFTNYMEVSYHYDTEMLINIY